MIENWTTESSRKVVDDRWLTVRADRVRTGRGVVLDPWYVIERADWVAIVALTADGRVVLTREYRHGAKVVGVGLPGGVVEAGEPALETAARELREETGYSCDRWVALGDLWANWKNQTNRLSIILGTGAALTHPQALDEGEDIEAVLMPWREWLEQMLTLAPQAYYVAASLLAERHIAAQGL